MNLRTLFLIIIFAVVATLMLWQPWQTDDNAIVDAMQEQSIPDFTADNLVTRIYEPSGRLSHRIKAAHMAHFSQQKLTELSKPTYATQIITSEENEVGELWQVSAFEGRLYDDEKLELIKQVKVTNLSNIGYIRNIETDYLAINLKTQRMYTDSPVTISGPQFIIRGVGLTVDIETQQLELIKHVETIYYPANVQR